MLNKVKMTQIH